MTTYDRTFSTEDTSSVIEAAYYNSDTKELYVELTRTDYFGDPVVAGYAGVPEDVFTAFELENNNRVNRGFGSVGAYWNRWIKPYFTGIDTAEVELVPAGSESEVTDVTTSEAVTLTNVSAAAEDEGELSTYGLIFVDARSDVTDVVGKILVDATSGEDAIDRFEKIAEIAGWSDVEIVSLTQFFVDL